LFSKTLFFASDASAQSFPGSEGDMARREYVRFSCLQQCRPHPKYSCEQTSSANFPQAGGTERATEILLSFRHGVGGRPGECLIKPRLVVAVALANRIARIAWALMTKGGIYRASSAAAA
jgi:hypothetical protein